MARDRKADDELDFVMDDAEAEEAVGASAPVVRPLPDGVGSAALADVGLPGSTAGTGDSEPVPQGAGATATRKEEPLAQEQAQGQRDRSAPGDGDEGNRSHDPSAPMPEDDVQMGQVIKRLRNTTSSREDSTAGCTAAEPEAGTFTKRSRVQTKPRIPPDDRRRKNSQ